MRRRCSLAAMSALREARVPAPDDTVAEVSGAPFTPLETTGAIGFGVLGLLMAGLMAILLAALAGEQRLSAAGIGQGAMLEALSTGLVAGLAGILLQPKRLKLIGLVASAALAAADLLTLRASGVSVLAVRAAAGVPEGLLLWITIGFIARTGTPERWAAVLFVGMSASQLAFAAGLSAFVLPRYGANGGYLAAALACVVGLAFAAVAPSRLGPMPGGDERPAGMPPPLGWLALAATLAMTASLSCVAVYVVPLAAQAGLGVGVGRTAISISLGCQILGAAIATAIAGHVRYLTIFWLAGLVFFATWAAYAIHAPAWLFIGLSGLAGFAGTLAGPFLVPMTIDVDPSRRTALQSGTIQLLAGALGPLLASLAVTDRNAHGVLALGAAMQLAGLLGATLLVRLARQRTAAA